ncbi:hypothetical protein O3P69_015257 [Scylla paramamosain]|uniref:Uncharacterized protein n=1 Tax=Scylla paramamosain TaxID=85552 RepID=A0AAW0T3M0_SCYPA
MDESETAIVATSHIADRPPFWLKKLLTGFQRSWNGGHELPIYHSGFVRTHRNDHCAVVHPGVLLLGNLHMCPPGRCCCPFD